MAQVDACAIWCRVLVAGCLKEPLRHEEHRETQKEGIKRRIGGKEESVVNFHEALMNRLH